MGESATCTLSRIHLIWCANAHTPTWFTSSTAMIPTFQTCNKFCLLQATLPAIPGSLSFHLPVIGYHGNTPIKRFQAMVHRFLPFVSNRAHSVATFVGTTFWQNDTEKSLWVSHALKNIATIKFSKWLAVDTRGSVSDPPWWMGYRGLNSPECVEATNRIREELTAIVADTSTQFRWRGTISSNVLWCIGSRNPVFFCAYCCCV
jgi:hypothetical protein